MYGTAFLLGLLNRNMPLTDEIYSRTTPNLMDLMIALGGGAGGAFSMISPRLSVAFVGVAIATALRSVSTSLRQVASEFSVEFPLSPVSG